MAGEEQQQQEQQQGQDETQRPNVPANVPPQQPKQPQQPQPQQSQDNSDLVPVDNTKKGLTPVPAGAAASAEELTPVEGTRKHLINPSAEELTPIESTRKNFFTPEWDWRNATATGIGPRRTGGAMDAFHNWLEDVQADVRNGTESTWIGSVLKKLGAKGTQYGVSPGAMSLIPNPVEGIPRALEILPEMVEADEALYKGKYKEALTHAERGLNAGAEGVFKSVGALPLVGATAVVAPEALPLLASSEASGALATAVPAMAAGNLAEKTAAYFGADEDTKKTIGNVVGLMVGTQAHTKLEVENFENAVNSRMNAEAIYKTRVKELEIARQQAEAARQRAISAAQDELNQIKNGNLTPEQIQRLKAQTDAARTAASAAAKNADTAKQALDIAAESRVEADLHLKRFSNYIQQKAAEKVQEEANRTKKNNDISREMLQKAIPAKGSDIYTPDDKGNYTKYDIIRSHLDAEKERGAPMNTILDVRNAAENARQRIEDTLRPEIEKIANEPLVDINDSANSPKMKVAAKLEKMAKLDSNFDNAMDYLDNFPLTDMTVGEAQQTLTKLNDYLRAMKKSSNNWDTYNQIETNPRFAAYWFLADEIRSSLYDKLEEAGVKNAAQARAETAALIDFRNAADAQLRRNAGEVTVRGSAPNGAMRNLIAKLMGKTIKGVATAEGAKAGGPTGAVIGGALGEMLAEPVEDYIAPKDMTRDEHVAKAMKNRGTSRKPVEIIGEAKPSPINEPPVPRYYPPPPDSPVKLELSPRENTNLHADLASYYKLGSLDERSYQDLENDLRHDIQVKKQAGIKLTSEEKKLWNQVLRLDAADRAIRAKYEAQQAKPQAQPQGQPQTQAQPQVQAQPGAQPQTGITPEEAQISSGAVQPATQVPTTQPIQETSEANQINENINPALQALGREDESALVSHSPASKAHSPAIEFKNLPKGVTSESIHRHEWSHAAIGAIDGIEPLEIRSNLHPTVPSYMKVATAFDRSTLQNLIDNPTPEMIAEWETKCLTMTMAGPASHEVFDNLTYSEIKKNPGMRSDFLKARALVRELHPDFSNAQVGKIVKAAYDRARDFLVKPHIADRIRANAAVREDNLPETLHASNGRVSQFAKDIRRAHNEYTGNESGSNEVDTGESNEKAAPEPQKEGPNTVVNFGGTDGERENESTATPKSASSGGGNRIASIPKERTTGNKEIDRAIKEGGGIPGGIQEGFEYKDKNGVTKSFPAMAYIHDPITGTSLNIPLDSVTPETVKERILESRREYGLESEPRVIKSNASGESSASLEAINRVNTEKSAGKQRIRIDTRSGKETPLIGVDAVDIRPGPYDEIVMRDKNGNETVLDRGPRALARKPKPYAYAK